MHMFCEPIHIFKLKYTVCKSYHTFGYIWKFPRNPLMFRIDTLQCVLKGICKVVVQQPSPSVLTYLQSRHLIPILKWFYVELRPKPIEIGTLICFVGPDFLACIHISHQFSRGCWNITFLLILPREGLQIFMIILLVCLKGEASCLLDPRCSHHKICSSLHSRKKRSRWYSHDPPINNNNNNVIISVLLFTHFFFWRGTAGYEAPMTWRDRIIVVQTQTNTTPQHKPPSK